MSFQPVDFQSYVISPFGLFNPMSIQLSDLRTFKQKFLRPLDIRANVILPLEIFAQDHFDYLTFQFYVL